MDLETFANGELGLSVRSKINNNFIAVEEAFNAIIDANPVSAWEYLTDAEIADVVSGAKAINVQPKLQAFIDDCIYFKRRPGYFPAGVYRCDKALHFGYGDTFTGAKFEGAGKVYRGQGGSGGFPFVGTAFVFTSWTDAGVVFQGQRAGTLSNCSIIGPNQSWILNQGLGHLAPAVDDLVLNNWIDPAGLTANPNVNGRYSVLAGVRIDPYSGPRPGVSYPDVAYPTWAGATQYNRAFSSEVILEDVEISGFVAAVAIQPCDADGNGDFVYLNDCQITNNVYMISVGNSQSRNVSIHNANVASHYALFTNLTHGRRQGAFGGTISNMSVGTTIKFFHNFSPVFAKAMTFIAVYGELIWHLGEFANQSTADKPIAFIGGEINFDEYVPSRGVPPYILGHSDPAEPFQGGQAMFMSMSDMMLGNRSVCPMGGARVELNKVTMVATERPSGTIPRYVAYAHNGTAGGFVGPAPVNGRYLNHLLQYLHFNPETGAAVGPRHAGDNMTQCGRDWGIPVWVDQVFPSSGPALSTPRRMHVFGKGAFSSLTLTGRQLEGTFTSRAAAEFAMLGPDVGDVMVDLKTGSTFFVSFRSGTTIRAQLQNNYRELSPGVFTTHLAFSTTVGEFLVYNTRLYSPSRFLRGDLTSGSGTLSNCGSDDGVALYDAEIAANDWLFVDAASDSDIAASAALITARNQGAGTITITGTASRSATRKRLGLFIRQAAPSV